MAHVIPVNIDHADARIRISQVQTIVVSIILWNLGIRSLCTGLLFLIIFQSKYILLGITIVTSSVEVPFGRPDVHEKEHNSKLLSHNLPNGG